MRNFLSPPTGSRSGAARPGERRRTSGGVSAASWTDAGSGMRIVSTRVPRSRSRPPALLPPRCSPHEPTKRPPPPPAPPRRLLRRLRRHPHLAHPHGWRRVRGALDHARWRRGGPPEPAGHHHLLRGSRPGHRQRQHGPDRPHRPGGHRRERPARPRPRRHVRAHHAEGAGLPPGLPHRRERRGRRVRAEPPLLRAPPRPGLGGAHRALDRRRSHGPSRLGDLPGPPGRPPRRAVRRPGRRAAPAGLPARGQRRAGGQLPRARQGRRQPRVLGAGRERRPRPAAGFPGAHPSPQPHRGTRLVDGADRPAGARHPGEPGAGPLRVPGRGLLHVGGALRGRRGRGQLLARRGAPARDTAGAAAPGHRRAAPARGGLPGPGRRGPGGRPRHRPGAHRHLLRSRDDHPGGRRGPGLRELQVRRPDRRRGRVRRAGRRALRGSAGRGSSTRTWTARGRATPRRTSPTCASPTASEPAGRGPSVGRAASVRTSRAPRRRGRAPRRRRGSR